MEMRADTSPEDQDILKLLEELGSIKARYPQHLLEKRRAVFLRQLEQRDLPAGEESYARREITAAELFARVKSAEPAYPENLLSARRLAFQKQAIQAKRVFWGQSIRSAIRDRLVSLTSPLSPMKLLRGSLVAAVLALAAFASMLLAGNRNQFASVPPRPVLGTTTAEIEAVVCKPGYEPPLCLAAEFDQSRDLTYAGNGSARPAVAKDTLSDLHQAANVNDGLYGPGASWISSSPNSWIKIDLGKPTTINTVAFGKDRLGKFENRDPGRFVISVAMVDDVYANGNSTNDSVEYKPVYDSAQVGFDGTIAGAATILAQFSPQEARYVKITFENPGTAVDEVEVFMIQPTATAPTRTRQPSPSQTATMLPTNTSLPADTATLVPTGTAIPSATATSVPTSTPVPSDTATSVPTATLLPTGTWTPAPTSTPVPTDTPFPTVQPTGTSFQIDIQKD